MNRIMESPTSSFCMQPKLSMRTLDFDIEPLCFNEEELDGFPESEAIAVADISQLRRGMGSMEVGGDDSILSMTSSFIGTSPGFLDCSEESGIGSSPFLGGSSFTSSSSETKSGRGSFHPTSAPVSVRKSRQSIGEVTRTPLKDHRFRPRTSVGAVDAVMYSIQEECNVNPFSADRVALGGQEMCRKRSAATMLSTPDLNSTKSSSLGSPESGYGSRHKVLKGVKVNFSLGSPIGRTSAKLPSEHATPTGRYEAEFAEVKELGSGHFGRVTKVLKRLDGVFYAIKRTKEEVHKTSFNSDVVREVFALAALDSHPNVLRYFSSWIEGGHLYMQSEYCDAGTLASHITDYKKEPGKRFEEEELRRVVRQAGGGLVFLHEHMLAHLDVKPDNILMSLRKKVNLDMKDGRPGTPDGDLGIYIYKIGDLGHVRSFREGPVENCVDGDKRYLAPELLHDMDSVLRDAPKADVYSLGISLFETACVNRAPSGTEIYGAAQRNGIIPGIVDFSLALNQLFQRMTALEPNDRPTMYDVTSDPSIHTSDKTNSELKMDLHVAHLENFALTKELAKASRASLQSFAPNKPKKLLMGRTTNRSVSTQAF